MIDIFAITNTLKREIKQRIVGKSPYGNIQWMKADNDWYIKIHEKNRILHENFIQYIKEKNDVKTVLEIGCGTGIYPIKYKELFTNMNYTGIDISKENIDYCKKNSNFNFICNDFLTMNASQKYDLVFSHAVIDHVYDIDVFISKICQSCKKYAYINSYRGYFPNLKKHKMKWRDDDGCYYNNISVDQIKQTLLKNNLKNIEFTISHLDNEDGLSQTVIKIHKNDF